jgi:hypothetical protein
MGEREDRGFVPYENAKRVEIVERVTEERWQAIDFRLGLIERGLERLEKRLWLGAFGVVSLVLAQAVQGLVLGV